MAAAVGDVGLPGLVPAHLFLEVSGKEAVWRC